jgi:hypothetical protein
MNNEGNLEKAIDKLHLDPEIIFFSNPAKIGEGVLLFEKSSNGVTGKGRVIFSLEDLPVNILFQNDKGTEIIKFEPTKLKITGKNIYQELYDFYLGECFEIATQYLFRIQMKVLV